MNVYNKITDLVGNTPLVELKRIEEKYNLKARIIAKVESFNPAGSVKDRIANGTPHPLGRRAHPLLLCRTSWRIWRQRHLGLHP